jgi:hypothetical protein
MTRIPLRLFIASVFTVLCFVSSTKAQDIQVPFDTMNDSADARIITLTRDLRDQLDLFPEYPGFAQANLFRRSPGHYSLEITLIDSGRTSRTTTPLDAGQVAVLRSDIRSRLDREKPTMMLDQEGRSNFLWTTAGLSFLYYGPAVAVNVATKTKSPAGIATAYAVTGGVGFFVPFLLTQNSRMTEGMASAARTGGTMGIIHTGLAYGALDLFENTNVEEFLAVSSFVSIAELTTGVLLANKYDIGEGHADLIGVGGAFGLELGVLSSLLVSSFDHLDPATITGAGLAGSLGGMYLANETALATEYTAGDSKALATGGQLGQVLTLAVIEQMGGDFSELHARMIVGSLAGSLLASCYGTHHWIGRRNFTKQEGNLIELGTTAGALVASGIEYYLDRNGEPSILAPALGAGLTFAILMESLGKHTSDKKMGERSGGSSRPVEFMINPVAIGMAAAKMEMTQHSIDRVVTLPIAGLSVGL